PGMLQLFGVGQDGRVYGAIWDGAWHDWVQIGTGVFSPNTPIAALSLSPSTLNLFGVGQDGGVYGAWWNGPWREWERIGSGVFSQNTPIAAIGAIAADPGLWLPGVEVIAGVDGGSLIGAPWRGVLHTTESDTAQSAIDTWGGPNGNNFWPHLTIE